MKNFNRKKVTITVSTLFISTLFISTLAFSVNATNLNKVEIIKAEKVSHAVLIDNAQMNLKRSFSETKLNKITDINTHNLLALQKVELNTSKPVTLSKIVLVTE